MGFATSITIAIFFISFTIIGTILYDDLYNSYSQIDDARRDQHEMWMDQHNTAIEITQIINTGGNNLMMTVENTGSTTLNTNDVTILLDGMYTTCTPDPSGFWTPGTDASFTVSATDEDHVLKISTENGISDIMEYYA